ncbi:NADP-dependent oxidoreductase [Acidisoma cladoniae]|jgi:NADPH:quinone reductase-like Zn-dependent oxidoreductase|uniref:NADP-dependent oxidoreductase n=1 Tax=Acidisoma cladoniae TaxID=3040935 RepID=UPI00254BB6E9|nr:NADP-dependent oxidoreductase [Acidisoma sp. PAMC 29798]
MPDNQAYRIHAYGGPEVLHLDDVPIPTAGPGQVLVAVKAVGANPFDWKLREGYLRQAYPLEFPTTIGSELAGVVMALGAGASRFMVGDRVIGFPRLGMYADSIVVDEDTLCRTPDALSDVMAASLPIASTTAWQLLRAAAEPRPGMTVLVHGAAGGVGGFAVQFAKAAGATVWATASATSRDYVAELGADTVIDYRAERFEDLVGTVDLVLDLVGGETLDRSWSVLARDGAIVSVAAPDITARAPAGARGIFMVVRPDPETLARIAQDVADGRLKSRVAEVFGRADLPAAIERTRTGHGPGKVVVDFTL